MSISCFTCVMSIRAPDLHKCGARGEHGCGHVVAWHHIHQVAGLVAGKGGDACEPAKSTILGCTCAVFKVQHVSPEGVHTGAW